VVEEQPGVERGLHHREATLFLDALGFLGPLGRLVPPLKRP
jgi:hypothetical protein